MLIRHRFWFRFLKLKNTYSEDRGLKKWRGTSESSPFRHYIAAKPFLISEQGQSKEGSTQFRGEFEHISAFCFPSQCSCRKKTRRMFVSLDCHLSTLILDPEFNIGLKEKRVMVEFHFAPL